MQFISIGVNECAESILQHINKELQQIKNKRIDCSVNEVEADGAVSIICSINEDSKKNENLTQPYHLLITHVSNALADYIIRQYEEKLIGRVIHTHYCYFNVVEKKEILELALRMIKNEDKNLINSIFQIRRRNVIVKKLLDYLEGSNVILLDGFVNFRLKDYMKDLEEIVDKAVDDFLMEREYHEFIRLLKYFVDIQDSQFDQIHIIVGFDNKYVLLDESKNEITNEYIQDFAAELNEGEINYDDLLVSSLITLAPRGIVIHGAGYFSNKELLETIKNVFAGKVKICTGCEICMVSRLRSENKK